ncbi:hypothetical protein AAVH_17533 [Aphelenchoides avenae]|nr:hypothetical protein AAVH_17533 [Aphelenchus avenae]
MLDFPQGNIGFVLLVYATNILFTAHAAIGVNRFLVLTDAWTARKGRIAIMAILLLSMPTALLRLIGRTTLIETKTPGVYSVFRDIPWFVGASTMVYHPAASAVTIVFELRSLICYKRLTAMAKEKYRSDFLLLSK